MVTAIVSLWLTLKASFMILNGAQKGSKFVMEKSQVIIGSDTTCDVCVSGKDVPRRLALVLQRGKEFFIEALAKDGMTMVLVTHEMAFARSVADQILFMNQGVVWEQGDGSLLQQPRTAELQQFVSSGL